MPFLVVILALGMWFVFDETRRQGTTMSNIENGTAPETTPEIDKLQQVVDSNPEDSGSLLRLANLLQDHAASDKRLLPRAIDAYKKYLGVNPSSENPRVDLGICYFEVSKIDSLHSQRFLQLARQEMEAVYKANPKHQAAAYNLGIVSLSAGGTTESAEWFRRAMEINPDSELGHRAKRLLEQHSFGESAE
jgi:tetratricopeptide (TPR) repeat protein